MNLVSEAFGVCQDIPTLVESLKCWHLRHLGLQISETRDLSTQIIILTQKELVRSNMMILDHSGIFWGVALITVVGFSAEVNRLCRECSCARLPYELAYTLMASFRMFSMPST